MKKAVKTDFETYRALGYHLKMIRDILMKNVANRQFEPVLSKIDKIRSKLDDLAFNEYPEMDAFELRGIFYGDIK